MNNVLYITYVDYLDNPFPGVQEKISTQIETMQRANMGVDLICQYGKKAKCIDNSGSIYIVNGITRRFAILNAVKKIVKKESYIAAYIRFQFFSEDVRQIVTLLKAMGTKVYMEIPTFPYEGELHRQGIKGEIKLFCDRLYRKNCSAKIDFFVSPSETSKIYGKPCIFIMNGMDYSCHPLRNVHEPKEDEANLLAVASMLPWHGYDRILYGLANYYKEKQNTNVVLHLVGSGKELKKYKEVVKENHLEDHVYFYGTKGGSELNNIASKCDIAVGSLAAFRVGITKLSTLKSREYCAWGLPSINATQTDILDNDDHFCLYIPEDDSPVNIYDVVNFYHKIYFSSGLRAIEIAKEIRFKAESCSDIHFVFGPVIKSITKKET